MVLQERVRKRGCIFYEGGVMISTGYLAILTLSVLLSYILYIIFGRSSNLTLSLNLYNQEKDQRGRLCCWVELGFAFT